MKVALVNTNRIHPPIAPIGIDYLAESLNAQGHQVCLLDLCGSGDWKSDIEQFFHQQDFGLVGVTLRNTDDCFASSRYSFLDEFNAMIATIKRNTDVPVVLGGCGFSVMPQAVLSQCGADAGVWGDGEFTFTDMADRIEQKRDWRALPNLVWKHQQTIHVNRHSLETLEDLPTMTRRWVDNQAYFREGGQIGIETKRGCPCACTYCADPLAKGPTVRLRPPNHVVDEWEHLLALGIDTFHTCDSEFNIPMQHALDICQEIIARNLGHQIHWYAYCSPAPFTAEVAKQMKRAGCVGINFGADNGNAGMVQRLQRNFKPDDIHRAAHACRQAGIVVMFDLLIGSPGETRESIIETIELMKQTDAELVGVSLGVRLYPGTRLTEEVKRGYADTLSFDENLLNKPVFFIEPQVAPFAAELIQTLIENDKRFFFSDPSCSEKDYNYNANQVLVEAIKQGHRGAYWDILRKIQSLSG